MDGKCCPADFQVIDTVGKRRSGLVGAYSGNCLCYCKILRSLRLSQQGDRRRGVLCRGDPGKRGLDLLRGIIQIVQTA